MNKDIIEIDLMEISQKNKQYYIAKINATDLISCYTVEPSEYNLNLEIEQANEFDDESDYLEHLKDIKKKSINDKNFQRYEDKERVKEIAKFLNNEEYSFFPNSVICKCDLVTDYSSKINTLDDYKNYINKADDSNLCFLDRKKLYIPSTKGSLLIIDGQHRVRGLEESNDDVKNNYDIILTLIIGYDKSIVAELFYTINYKQQKVNKSVLYHLTGEFSKELNEITFFHEALKLLNELENSPFYERIKMLGNARGHIGTDSQLKKATISQAFLIDYLSGTIKISSLRSIHPPIFYFYYKNEDYQIEIIRFIRKYFKAVEKLKEDEWNSDNSLICKTVVLGALIKVMHFVFVKLFKDLELKKDPTKISEIRVSQIKKELNNIKQMNFQKDGDYSGSGGGASLGKIRLDILEKIGYIKADLNEKETKDKYKSSLNIFKEDYIEPFKNWLKKQEI